MVSGRERSRLLDAPARGVRGLIQGFPVGRKNAKTMKYWQTLMAYSDAVWERRAHNGQGWAKAGAEQAPMQTRKWGILKRAGETLKERYGWEALPASYTVRRYLDRAERLWQIGPILG